MLDLILAVNYFRTEIPTTPPFEAPVLSDLHFPQKVGDAVKILSAILQSVSKFQFQCNQVSGFSVTKFQL